MKLAKLRGSKYVQSDVGQTYIAAQAYLESGREVLYTGTPCEIEGLKTFLHKDYSNLICVDLICHGVPSPKLWKKYVCYREQCAGALAQRTFFRHKKYGWKTYAVLFEFSNNTAYEQVVSKDLFMQMFLQDICLRPSCYQCDFKKMNRVSDLTIADFWGCDEVCPDLDDDKGLSLIITQSKKGMELITTLVPNLVLRKVDTARSLSFNSSMTHSCPKPVKRDDFMSDIDTVSIPELANRYLKKTSLLKKMAKKVNSFRKRIARALNTSVCGSVK